MLDRQRWARHAPATAAALALALAFVTLSLRGYDPADPPGDAAWPPNQPIRNACGPVGAAAAHMLFSTFGLASWLLVGAAAAAVVSIATRAGSLRLGRPALGLALVLAVAAATAQKFGGKLDAIPPVGAGGYVGAFAAAFLEGQFGPVGMVLIGVASLAAGLILCGRVLVVEPAFALLNVAGSWSPWGRSSAPDSAAHAPRPTTAADLAASVAPMPYSPRSLASPVATNPARALVHAGSSGFGASHQSALQRDPAPPQSTRFESNLPAARTHARPPAPGDFQLPPLDLLEPPSPFPVHEHEAKIQSRALMLEKTLLEHGCVVRVVQIDTGPVITQFEVELEAGLRVSRIVGLSNDLAIALAVPSVRIVAPIPGKTTVGIEVPNERRGIVKLGEVVAGVPESVAKFRIPLFLGKDVKGAPLAFDLVDMPHLLIAGRTGTGKSVCLNAMILSILMTRRPDEVKLILIDPKMVELSQFKRIPHLMHPVVTDMKKAESLLAWACEKMDERYTFLARAKVRNIQSYNQLGEEEVLARIAPEDDEERARIPTYMPHIVIIADEMADLMMTAAKEVEHHIVRLAQKARAVGMHLIVATQKPTVDVITGLIKGNLPARIAFQVAGRSDSRVVLDEMGADKLLGNGDMLFLIPGTSHVIRAQGTYVSDAEVNLVCDYLQQYPVDFSRELMQLQVGGGPGGKDRGAALKERDELYEPAIEVVIREGRGSCSLLQRALGIGYGRAARLIDFMAEDGIVGEYKTGAAREVLYSWEEWEAMKNGSGPSEAA